jgi:hypothetical protein
MASPRRVRAEDLEAIAADKRVDQCEGGAGLEARVATITHRLRAHLSPMNARCSEVAGTPVERQVEHGRDASERAGREDLRARRRRGSDRRTDEGACVGGTDEAKR